MVLDDSRDEVACRARVRALLQEPDVDPLLGDEAEPRDAVARLAVTGALGA